MKRSSEFWSSFRCGRYKPDEELLTMMGHIGSQLGQVIIRQRAEEDLQRAKAPRSPRIAPRANF